MSDDEKLPDCTRCGHPADAHRIDSDALIQDPTDERARFHCVGYPEGDRFVETNCGCPNYERWTRP
jgi:hypothetical protein